MAPGNRAITAMVEAFEAQSAPYREAAADMRTKDKRRIDAILELRRTGMPDRVLHEATMACGQLDVFEAVREGVVTPEEGGWFLELRRRPQSWLERMLRWAAWGARSGGNADA